ncbi:hypothetical protein AB5I41_14550 [Sphingomonas sp. MMS24-JH45]
MGYRRVNVIDLAPLTLHRPTIVHDLPGGGRRSIRRPRATSPRLSRAR